MARNIGPAADALLRASVYSTLWTDSGVVPREPLGARYFQKGEPGMKFQTMGQAALVACAFTFIAHAAHAERQRDYQNASNAAETAGASLASYNSYNSFEPCGCDSCASGSCCGECCDASCGCSSSGGGSSCGCSGDGGLGLGAGLLGRSGQFFGYAEYIYARASFSEATAFVVQDPADPLGGQIFNQFDFDYTSSYRFGGGYRFCDCGGEIVFNFGRYRSDADFNVQGLPGANVGAEILTPYEIDAFDETQFVTGSADVDLRSYDLGVAKTIPLGSPMGCCDCGDCCECGDCGNCGDSCCCWCPAWDITWSAGVRFAEADWTRATAAFQTGGVTTVPIDSAVTRLDFEGTGLRWGMLGRRYLGRQGWLSAYVKGDISLLVGRVNVRVDTFNPQAGLQRVAEISVRNVIPVTEIEAGVTGHLGRHIQVSSGYFISAWHDLGMRDTYDFGGQLSHWDDANILGFDGYFARAEVAF